MDDTAARLIEQLPEEEPTHDQLAEAHERLAAATSDPESQFIYRMFAAEHKRLAED